MSGILAHLSGAILDACVKAETTPSAEYRQAADLIPAYSRRHHDADDIASVARVILADVMASGYVGSHAAQTAVKRASAWAAADRRAEPAVPIGDTASADAEGCDTLARAYFPAPDACTRWSTADTMAEVWDAADDTTAAYLSALLSADVWPNDTRERSSKINVAALARTLYGAERGNVGRVRAACREALSESLTEARALAHQTINHYGLPSMASERERGLVRDTREATSGPASAVVITTRNGDRWATLADRSVMVTADGAAYVLAQTDTLAPYDGGTAREVLGATLAQAQSASRPAQRVPGVSVDRRTGEAVSVWGHAGIGSGGGKAAQRPMPSRKRRRDGGIGSPMVPASR